jgi:hypothetical protein
MSVEWARVEASFAVKSEKTECAPNDPNRLAVQKLNDNACHTHPIPGETGQGMACWIPEHLIKPAAWQAIQVVVLVEQEYT